MNIIGAVSVVGMGAEDGNSCKSGSRKMEGVEGGGYRAGEVEVQAATGNNSVHAVGGTSLDEEAGRTASSQVVRPEGFWSVFFSSIAKIGSAGLYLSDYVSNILVMREYYILYRTDSFGGVSNVVIGIEPFLICLAFIILDPIVTAIIFKLKLPAREHPLRSAFFLPLVQLKRFIQGFFKTGSCAGANKVLESDETEALFAAAVAIETGPQTMLQFTVIALVGTNLDYRRWFPSPILIISLLFSFLSASYNIGRAVMFKLSKQWSFALNAPGIAGGLLTFGVLLLKCTTVASIILTSSLLLDPSILTYIVINTLYFGLGMCIFSYVSGVNLALSKERKICTWRTQLEVFTAAYINATIGPLYATVDSHETKDYNPGCKLCKNIALATSLNFFTDVVALIILAMLRKTTCQLEARKYATTVARLHKTPIDDLISTFTCFQFKMYVGLGIVLTFIPCVILLFIISLTPIDKNKK